MDVKVTNEAMGNYYGQSEGAMRALKKANRTKFEAMKEAFLEHLESELLSDNPFVIMSLMFKGGVGKSALSRIMNQKLAKHKSVILNLDISRDVKKYTSEEAINYAEMKEEEADIEPDELVRELKEIANYVILDTAGEVSSEETLNAVKEVDLFVMPFGIDEEEVDTLKMTIETLFFSELGLYPIDKPLNILLVLNNYREDEYLKEFGTIVEDVKRDIIDKDYGYPKVNISVSDLKYSKAIPTMNKTKKSISELSTEHLAAYRIVKNRIKKFMKDLKGAINTAREDI